MGQQWFLIPSSPERSPGGASMPDLRESEQLNELYRLYGIAAHNCCNIEYRIYNLLLGPKWKQEDKLTPEKVTQISEQLERLPLGALLKEYKQYVNFTDEQLSLVKDVLDKRNYLTHRFFGKYGKKMHDPSIQKEMISELQKLIVMFQSVSRSFDPALSVV
jgi:hypothetical protein